MGAPDREGVPGRPADLSQCGGKLKIVVYLHDQLGIRQILQHLGLVAAEESEPLPAIHDRSPSPTPAPEPRRLLLLRPAKGNAYEFQDALKTARGNHARAARLLDTTERIIGYKIKKYGIDAERFTTKT